MSHELKLFRCTEESGTLKVTEVKNGPLSQSDLSSDVSILSSCIMLFFRVCVSYREIIVWKNH